MQPLSAGSSLSSSNAFAISTGNSNAMMSSGTTNNGIANNVSSTSSASLQQQIVIESKQKFLKYNPSTCIVDALTIPQSDPEKLKEMQHQLGLLLHAHKCQECEREQASNQEYRPCALPNCYAMKTILNHMQGCQDSKACQGV